MLHCSLRERKKKANSPFSVLLEGWLGSLPGRPQASQLLNLQPSPTHYLLLLLLCPPHTVGPRRGFFFPFPEEESPGKPLNTRALEDCFYSVITAENRFYFYKSCIRALQVQGFPGACGIRWSPRTSRSKPARQSWPGTIAQPLVGNCA